jgi:hypothetical protein
MAVRTPERAKECRTGIRDAFRERIIFSVRRRNGFYIEISAEHDGDRDQYPGRDPQFFNAFLVVCLFF